MWRNRNSESLLNQPAHSEVEDLAAISAKDSLLTLHGPLQPSKNI